MPKNSFCLICGQLCLTRAKSSGRRRAYASFLWPPMKYDGAWGVGSVCLSVCLSACLSVCLCLYMCLCVSMCVKDGSLRF
jgi:hypothetical protein